MILHDDIIKLEEELAKQKSLNNENTVFIKDFEARVNHITSEFDIKQEENFNIISNLETSNKNINDK